MSINWDSPLTRGLAALYVPEFGPIELVRRQPLVKFNNPQTTGGEARYGRSPVTVLRPTTSGPSYTGLYVPFSASAGPYDASAPPITLFGIGTTSGNQGDCFILRGRGSGDPSYSCGVWYGSFSGAYARVVTTGGSLSATFIPTGLEIDTREPTAVVVVIDTSTTTVYAGRPGFAPVDIRSAATPSGTFDNQFNDEYRTLSFGASYDGVSAVAMGGAVYGRAWSRAEVELFFRAPFDIVAKPQRRLVVLGAGGGGATESRTVSVSGVGDAAWQATAINAQTIASAGVGAASWQGVAITARQLASDGVAAASWQGGAVVGQTIASAGVAAVAFDGVALAPASLSAAGSAAASWQATSIAAATVASAGQASAAWQSVWVHQQAFSSAGVAAASWVGTDASGGTTIEPRTIASAGVGSATWQASVVAAADLVSDGIGAAAWQAAARVVAAFTSAGSSAFAPESARIDVRTLTAAGVGAAAFDGQDAGTVEARTFSSGGAASVSFAVEGEPERAHGFEIGPATTKPKRRGLVVVDETEEKPARQKITKRDIDRRVFERAREEARAVIAKAAEQHATTQHVKAERFAQVRTALKPLAKAIGDWNWIAVYQRMYQQALDEQIRQELAREDAIAAEAQAAEEADERELMNLIMEWM